ncbi:MAG: hypothetical protein ACLTD2_05125 [Ruminococcus sp.]
MAKTFKGIDVSQYQQSVDFQEGQGFWGSISLSFVQASANTLIRKDPYFEKSYKAAKAAGVESRCLLV